MGGSHHGTDPPARQQGSCADTLPKATVDSALAEAIARVSDYTVKLDGLEDRIFADVAVHVGKE